VEEEADWTRKSSPGERKGSEGNTVDDVDDDEGIGERELISSRSGVGGCTKIELTGSWSLRIRQSLGLLTRWSSHSLDRGDPTVDTIRSPFGPFATDDHLHGVLLQRIPRSDHGGDGRVRHPVPDGLRV
jgi:hypothetical protein